MHFFSSKARTGATANKWAEDLVFAEVNRAGTWLVQMINRFIDYTPHSTKPFSGIVCHDNWEKFTPNDLGMMQHMAGDRAISDSRG